MKLNSSFYEKINSLFKAFTIIHPWKPLDPSSGFYCISPDPVPLIPQNTPHETSRAPNAWLQHSLPVCLHALTQDAFPLGCLPNTARSKQARQKRSLIKFNLQRKGKDGGEEVEVGEEGDGEVDEEVEGIEKREEGNNGNSFSHLHLALRGLQLKWKMQRWSSNSMICESHSGVS